MLLNPAITTGWSAASVPPAIARSASPRRIISYASPMAWPAVAQALTAPNEGPCAPKWIAVSPAAMLPIAAGTRKGEMRDGPRSAKIAACSKIVTAPPRPEPMIVAVDSAAAPLKRGGNPAEASASAVAVIANWLKRSRRLICFASSRSDGSNPCTWPPKFTSWPSRFNPSRRRTPERPARSPDQSASAPRPSGDTAPRPVTTTRTGFALNGPASRCEPWRRDTRHQGVRVRSTARSPRRCRSSRDGSRRRSSSPRRQRRSPRMRP